MSGELVLSCGELDALGEALRVDVRQLPFTIPQFGVTKEDRARQFEAAHHSLRERGLISGNEFAPELVQCLNVYGRAPFAVVLLGNTGDEEHVGLGAFDDRDGVVVAQHGDEVRFSLMPSNAVVRGLVGRLKAFRPGPGAAVTVPDDRRDDEDFADFRVTAAARGATAVTAEGILRRPRLGGGYFRVVSRERNGRETRLGAVSWVDNDQGRYAVLRGAGHSVFLPADQAVLDREISKILNLARG